jgi:hypothetical protein
MYKYRLKYRTCGIGCQTKKCISLNCRPLSYKMTDNVLQIAEGGEIEALNLI